MDETMTMDVRAPGAVAGDVLVTVIIPLARREIEPGPLLAMLPPDFEVILARGGTRASSMNDAAAAARGRHLWFVHADTTLTTDAVDALRHNLAEASRTLAYFDLRFDAGGLMRVTEAGVRFRSRVFGIPFGDQALCLPADLFRVLGGYDETVPFGEDHLLVRQAHRLGVAVRPIGAEVVTSARKYRQQGWFRTTLTHLWRTLSQSLASRRRTAPRRLRRPPVIDACHEPRR